MFRLLIACVLGCAVFGLIAWQFGLITPGKDNAEIGPDGRKAAPTLNLGGSLYPAQPMPKSPAMPTERRRDPVVIAGTIAVIDHPEIAAQIAGQLMYIGEEIPEGALQAAGAGAFLAEPFNFALVNHGKREVVKPYRRLKEGQKVYENQVLAVVNTAKALGDLATKRSKITAAKAEADGAKAISNEAAVKFEVAERLNRTGSIASEEYRSAKLTADKMYLDSIGKQAQWKLAMEDENLSNIAYKQHKIRNEIPRKYAYIQKIYKQRGEAVKDLEPVMQLYSLDPLMAEAQIDAQYKNRLHEGMTVTIEPSLVDSPPKMYPGHVSAVNCLAVTHDKANPLIVSGGEDHTVLVWSRYEQRPVRQFHQSEAVRALACTPRGAAHNLVLVGCADGSLRLYDLDKAQDKALVKEIHDQGSAITALAFSPDGKYFVSGTEEGGITLWNTAKMDAVYPLDFAHGVADTPHGSVTSLHFTPQCKLVAASLDHTIRVWSLKEKGAVSDYGELAGRSGSVGALDVSDDGRWLLFDQGKTLQIRSVADGVIVNTLQNPGGVIPFETLAEFSPDASLLLTAGAPEGRLQLWRTPTEAERGFEVRQLAPPEHASVTCAAFAPLTDYNREGSFAVSGNKDGQIYLWPLPSRAAVNDQPIRNIRVSQMPPGLNPSTRKVTIGFEVPNPPTPQHPRGRLESGTPVTIVIE